MFIKRLFLTNFRNFGAEPTRIDFGPDGTAPRVFLAGRNNAGKSSVIDAVMWALTGKCRGLDGRGAGVDRLRRRGIEPTETMGVRVDLHRIGTVQREHGPAGVALQTAKYSGPMIGQQAALYADLRVNEGVLRALLDGAAFLNLAHEDAKQLLMEVIGVAVDLSPATQARIVAAGLAKDAGASVSLTEIDALYKAAYAARTAANKRLKTLPATPEAPSERPPDVARLEEKLKALRAEAETLAAEHARASGRRDALVGERRRVADRVMTPAARAEVDARLAALRDERAAVEGTPIPTYVPTETAELGVLQRKLVDASGRLTVLDARAEAIKAPGKTCILDAAVPCKTSAAAFEKAAGVIRAEADAVRAEVDALQADFSALALQLREAERATQTRIEIADRLRALDAKIERDTRILDEQAALAAQLADLDKQLEANPLTEAPPALLDLRARIVHGETVIRDARALLDKAHAYTRAVEQRRLAEEEAARLDLLVEELGPKGLRVDALQRTVGAFVAAINAPLARFGYTLDLSIDPWAVLVNGGDAALLSVSERLRVGVALQLALADATGIKFAAIDGVDLLDAGNRRIFSDVIAGWDGQLLIAGTRDSIEQTPRSTDTVSVYWIAPSGADGAAATAVLLSPEHELATT